MAFLTPLLTRRGAGLLGTWRIWRDTLRFAGRAIVFACAPSAYNSATRDVVMKQIYFTAWQILPLFTLFAALLSYMLIQIVVSTAAQFGYSEYALELSVRMLVLEILPLLTALFVALRSSSAINTEVALMKIQGEIEALEDAGVDTLRLEFMPRVIGGVVSVLALVTVSSALTLVLAYVAVYGPQPWSLPDFSRVMAKVFDAQIMLGLLLKTLAFGLAVTVIPVAEGLATPRKLFMAPVSVLRGMVRLFFVLMLIEMLSLAYKYT
ncbi:MAG: ABC-type transport system permease [bacterium]|nr:MAG: ABC-type transport system permease [bacterium]KAF0149508.1 MAG: ABC-type transport system permease [bacterium]KAF0168734.1 MAG: ABC-type transport system permease [bacterium]TXT20436.1 MAG: ABC-type transport system permease [bacterium]